MDSYQTQSNQTQPEEPEESMEPPHPCGGSNRLNLVADEDAAVYEEQHAGVQFSYILQVDEVYEALRREDANGPVGKKMTRRLWVLGGFLVVFLVLGFSLPSEGEGYLKASVLLGLAIFIVWFFPFMQRRGIARQIADGRQVYLAVYPDEVEIGRGEGAWKITLDGTAQLDMTQRIMALHTKEHILVIPQRSIEPALRADVIAILAAGTKKYPS